MVGYWLGSWKCRYFIIQYMELEDKCKLGREIMPSEVQGRGAAKH